jgi:hypothetical protein
MSIIDSESAIYQIKVRGRLGETWSAWFDGMTITVEKCEHRATITTLAGPVADQAALHGILSRIRDLGLPLLLVQHMGEEKKDVHL